MISTLTQTRVRHMLPGELPSGLWPTFESSINYHWAWVAADDQDRVIACLLAAPAHGVVILLRLWASSSAPRMTFKTMFREIAQKLRGIGMTSWMVMLEADKPKELRLAKLALMHKAVGIPFVGLIYKGELEVVCQKH